MIMQAGFNTMDLGCLNLSTVCVRLKPHLQLGGVRAYQAGVMLNLLIFLYRVACPMPRMPAAS